MDLYDVRLVRDVYSYIFQLLSESVQGFGATGGQNLAIPINLVIDFYNSLYYRTSRDKSNLHFRFYIFLLPN